MGKNFIIVFCRQSTVQNPHTSVFRAPLLKKAISLQAGFQPSPPMLSDEMELQVQPPQLLNIREGHSGDSG